MLRVHKILRWLPCCLIFFIASCGTVSDKNIFSNPDVIETKKSKREKIIIEKGFRTIKEEISTVLSGDLIMRTGNDFTSDVMRKLSQGDKTYSHGGIASLEKDTLFIYHAMGGEWNPDKKIRRDPFELFCNPYENKGFGIFRYQLDDQQKALFLSNVKAYYEQGVLFDLKFDLATDDKMYCTEYIYKSLNPILPLPTSVTNGIEYVAPDNLYQISECTVIQQIDFQ